MKKKLCCALLSLAIALPLCVSAFAVEAPVLAPSGLLKTADGGLMVADLYHHAIWKQDAQGTFTRYAGRDGIRDVNGVPLGAYIDGDAEKAAFETPWAIAAYLDGYAVTDTENNAVRYIRNGIVHTLAGSGTPGNANGVGAAASFDGPTGIALGADGCLYVADTGNHTIRKIDAKGNVSTFAGGDEGLADGSLAQARFSEPTGLFYADNTLYIADSGNHRIAKIANDSVATVAGNGEEGASDGSIEQASFCAPQGIAAEQGTIYVADTGNGAIRMIRDHTVSTLMKAGGADGAIYPVVPRGLALSDNVLYVGDIFSQVIFPIPLSESNSPIFFEDIPPNASYADAVSLVCAQGLMIGVESNQFDPSGFMERSMCIAALERMDSNAKLLSSSPSASNFSDVPANAYYAAALDWAISNHIVYGENGQFFPSRAVTRAEFAAFLYRYAKHSGKDLSINESASLGFFEDSVLIPDWAADALLWNVSSGFMQNDDDQTIAPLRCITRAEAATIFAQYLTKYASA